MLLWNFCVRLRNDPCGDEDKAEYALEAWAETQTIQDSLDMHVCNLNTTLLYIAREYLCKYVFGSSDHFHRVSDIRLPSVQLADDDCPDPAEVSSSSIRLSVQFLIISDSACKDYRAELVLVQNSVDSKQRTGVRTLLFYLLVE